MLYFSAEVLFIDSNDYWSEKSRYDNPYRFHTCFLICITENYLFLGIASVISVPFPI